VTDIVKVGAERAQDMAAIHAQCFEQPWAADTFRRLMDHKGTFALIARDDDQATASGFGLVRVAGGESELLSLGVVPAARRRGHAAKLLAVALDHSAVAGAAHMVLEVAEDNLAALGLYRAYLFRPVGRRVRYYARPGGAADAITMKKSLRSAPSI